VSREPWVKPKPPKPKPKPSDFSEEYAGKKVEIKMHDGTAIDGVVLEARRYWFKVKGPGEKVFYVNKGFVKWIELPA